MVLRDLFSLMGVEIEDMADGTLSEIYTAMSVSFKLSMVQQRFLESAVLRPDRPLNIAISESEKQQLITYGCVVVVADGINGTRYAVTVTGRNVFLLIAAQNALKDKYQAETIQLWKMQNEEKLLNSVVSKRAHDLSQSQIEEAANINGEFVALWTAKHYPSKLQEFPEEVLGAYHVGQYLRTTPGGLAINQNGTAYLKQRVKGLEMRTGATLWTRSILFYSDQPNSLYTLIFEFVDKGLTLDDYFIGLFKSYGFLNRIGRPTQLLYDVTDNLRNAVKDAAELTTV